MFSYTETNQYQTKVDTLVTIISSDFVGGHAYADDDYYDIGYKSGLVCFSNNIVNKEQLPTSVFSCTIVSFDFF